MKMRRRIARTTSTNVYNDNKDLESEGENDQAEVLELREKLKDAEGKMVLVSKAAQAFFYAAVKQGGLLKENEGILRAEANRRRITLGRHRRRAGDSLSDSCKRLGSYIRNFDKDGAPTSKMAEWMERMEGKPGAKFELDGVKADRDGTLLIKDQKNRTHLYPKKVKPFTNRNTDAFLLSDVHLAPLLIFRKD